MTVSAIQTPTAVREAPRKPRTFDGVVCFGGCDWWYHNRGHYDLQMMKHFSETMPVLYVNSIGIRIPKMGEGSMFFKRVIRKLKSWSRGFVKIHDTFGVLSPIVVPGKKGLALSHWLFGPQVRFAAKRMGIRRPLVWVNTPNAILLADSVEPVGMIYERTDRWEAFPQADPKEILAHDRLAKSRADLVLYCSRLLFGEEAGNCNDALYVDHGVDYDRFEKAGDNADTEPQDMKQIPRPRVGLVGALDAHKIDMPLLNYVARELSDVQFILVGASSLPEGWCTMPNCHMLGQRPYEQVANYMAACDVLMMPWNQNDWIQACNPVKLKEYLATGRPVVSTWFEELKNYDAFVRVARTPEQFVSHIRAALTQGCDVAAQRRRVQRETWRHKHEMVIERLAHLGLFAQSKQVGRE